MVVNRNKIKYFSEDTGIMLLFFDVIIDRANFPIRFPGAKLLNNSISLR